jgi:exosome complex RNA-binding protein Rrp42 (RNase PH superfamily)
VHHKDAEAGVFPFQKKSNKGELIVSVEVSPKSVQFNLLGNLNRSNARQTRLKQFQVHNQVFLKSPWQ